MSIEVKHFDDTGAEKALKECPKLVRDYVKKLKESNKHWQKLCGMAVNKLKKASKNNCDLPVVSVECEHPFAYVHTRCMGEINHCLKCGKDL